MRIKSMYMRALHCIKFQFHKWESHYYSVSDNIIHIHSLVMKFDTHKTSMIFSIVLTVLLFANLSIRFQLFRAPAGSLRAYEHDLCLLYDKPKRTGSTTIARAIHECWHGVFDLKPYRRPRPTRETVNLMLDSNRSVVAHALHHVYFSDADCVSVYANCRHVFHVTSTRRMNERLASYAKVVALQRRNLARNSTVTPDDLRKAASVLVKEAPRLERLYEKGVYHGRHTIPVDYVIRHEFLDRDLSALLRAFHCSPNVDRKNVHAVDSSVVNLTHLDMLGSFSNFSHALLTDADIDKLNLQQVYYFLSNFPLAYGDRLHNQFTKLAKRVNENGLKKASSFESISGIFRTPHESVKL